MKNSNNKSRKIIGNYKFVNLKKIDYLQSSKTIFFFHAQLFHIFEFMNKKRKSKYHQKLKNTTLESLDVLPTLA